MHHPIAFEEADREWRYSIDSKMEDAAIVAVIDPETLGRRESFRSFMAGGANVWEPEVGLMLKQVADVELPQMFRDYRSVTTYQEPETQPRRITLVLRLNAYRFADFRTNVTVQATAFGPGKMLLFDRSYDAEGIGQGGKVVWAGAFGMKSAVRQSTLDAYKKVFAAMRPDLQRALADPLSLG